MLAPQAGPAVPQRRGTGTRTAQDEGLQRHVEPGLRSGPGYVEFRLRRAQRHVDDDAAPIVLEVPPRLFQDAVRLVHFLELGFGRLVTPVAVGVVPYRQAAIRLLQVVLGRVGSYAEDLARVSLAHGHAPVLAAPGAAAGGVEIEFAAFLHRRADRVKCRRRRREWR